MKFRQLEHEEVENNQKQFPIAIVLEDVRMPGNVGMIFRLAEAFGVSQIFLCQGTATPPNRRISRAARSTIARMEYETSESTVDVLIKLKSEGYSLVGLEVTDDSQVMRNYNFKRLNKIGLVIGAEKGGISPKTLEQLDACVAIPMYGQISSLNVATATSICLYEVTSQMASI